MRRTRSRNWRKEQFYIYSITFGAGHVNERMIWPTGLEFDMCREGNLNILLSEWTHITKNKNGDYSVSWTGIIRDFMYIFCNTVDLCCFWAPSQADSLLTWPVSLVFMTLCDHYHISEASTVQLDKLRLHFMQVNLMSSFVPSEGRQLPVYKCMPHICWFLWNIPLHNYVHLWVNLSQYPNKIQWRLWLKHDKMWKQCTLVWIVALIHVHTSLR